MTDKIRCIVVDDEKLARDGISHLLETESDFELIDSCSNGREAIESILHFQPDVVFLDIKMPDLTGFDVLDNIPDDRVPIIVFVTAFDKFAIDAFEAKAFDYLLKPFDDDRFYKLLDRVRKQYGLIHSNKTPQDITALLNSLDNVLEKLPDEKQSFLQRIMVKRDGGISFIDCTDIICLEASDYYVKVITRNEEHLLRKSLGSFEEKLDPSIFLRIHRCTIVNVSAIKKIEHLSKGEFAAVLENNKPYRISKAGRKKLEERFSL